MTLPDVRPGEDVLEFNPAERTDVGICFVGAIRTPWARGNCPKNIIQAREEGADVWIELDTAYLAGLKGIEVGQNIVLMYWMDQARRDLITQTPKHLENSRGTFALRSPNRPNPVSLATVTITSLDITTGRIGIDAIDCFDRTPLVDIKPWLPSIDLPATGLA